MPSIEIDSGPLDSIQDAANWYDQYLKAYSIEGYSTRLAISRVDGKWYVRGSRWSSSD